MIINPYVFASTATVQFDYPSRSGSWTLTESGRVATNNSANSVEVAIRLNTPIVASSAKYFEVYIIAAPDLQFGVGVTNDGDSSLAGNWYVSAGGYMYYGLNSRTYNNGGSIATALSNSAAGDTVGVCLKNGKIYWSRNGVWTGNPSAETGSVYTGLSGNYYPALYAYKTNAAGRIRLATADLVYPIPTGASAMLP